jgi:hypothetical protein
MTLFAPSKPQTSHTAGRPIASESSLLSSAAILLVHRDSQLDTEMSHKVGVKRWKADGCSTLNGHRHESNEIWGELLARQRDLGCICLIKNDQLGHRYVYDTTSALHLPRKTLEVKVCCVLRTAARDKPAGCLLLQLPFCMLRDSCITVLFAGAVCARR